MGNKGQTLIEAVIALSALMIVLTAISILEINGLSNAKYLGDQNRAAKYAQEGIEYLRNLANTDSTTFNTYAGLSGTSNPDICFPENNGKPTLPSINASGNFTDPNPYATQSNNNHCIVNISDSYIRQFNIQSNATGCTGASTIFGTGRRGTGGLGGVSGSGSGVGSGTGSVSGRGTGGLGGVSGSGGGSSSGLGTGGSSLVLGSSTGSFTLIASHPVTIGSTTYQPPTLQSVELSLDGRNLTFTWSAPSGYIPVKYIASIGNITGGNTYGGTSYGFCTVSGTITTCSIPTSSIPSGTNNIFVRLFAYPDSTHQAYIDYSYDYGSAGSGSGGSSSGTSSGSGSSSTSTPGQQVSVKVFWTSSKCPSSGNTYCHSTTLTACLTNTSQQTQL